jgi:CBS domain-containing protein
MLSQPVERYILSEVVTIHSASPCVKAMALMEKHNTTFLLVVDGEKYKGIVNVQAIAKRMMQVNRPR